MKLYRLYKVGPLYYRTAGYRYMEYYSGYAWHLSDIKKPDLLSLPARLVATNVRFK